MLGFIKSLTILNDSKFLLMIIKIDNAMLKDEVNYLNTINFE